MDHNSRSYQAYCYTDAFYISLPTFPQHTYTRIKQQNWLGIITILQFWSFFGAPNQSTRNIALVSSATCCTITVMWRKILQLQWTYCLPPRWHRSATKLKKIISIFTKNYNIQDGVPKHKGWLSNHKSRKQNLSHSSPNPVSKLN